MSNELTRTGDTMLLNFADHNSALKIPILSISQVCIDALVIAKAGIGINAVSVLNAINNVFISGEYGHAAIVAEMKTIIPETVIVDPFESYEERTRTQWLSERQRRYFQEVQLGGITSLKSAGDEAYNKVFEADLPTAMDALGLTQEKMLLRLEQMMYDEDTKVSMQAIKMIADMRGEGQAGKVHADRKRKENSAKIKLATKVVERMGGEKGSVHDAQNAAALEAYKKRMGGKGIKIAEVVQ